MLIDIHTHQFRIEQAKNLQFIVGKHSLGIHPWQLNNSFNREYYQEKLQDLKLQFNKKILAIGECGLDRRRADILGLEDQEEILKLQLEWANAVKRPIIIHCVKSYADLLKVLKSISFKRKILIHDFSGNLKIAQDLLSYDCYFSFGKRLMDKKSSTNQVFPLLPKEKLFLETDDQNEVLIEEIYNYASALLGIKRNELEVLIENNLRSFFSDLDDISASDIIDCLRNT